MRAMIGIRGWQRTVTGAAMLAASVTVCWSQQKSNGAAAAAANAAAMQQQMAMAQQSTGSPLAGTTPNPRQAGINSPLSAGPVDDPSNFLADAVRVKRNDERQRKLESDTQRLLNLANQLKSEVAASGAESMTPAMVRQMEEIEKLAKSVKERMRS